MKILTTTDREKVRVTDEETVILAEDIDWMKELAGNIRNCSDRQIIQDAEHDFYEEMETRYGGKAAGELLGRLWGMCK